MNLRRSGNRGDCSQPCRVTYDLVDGAGRRLIEGRHSLLGGLNLSQRLGELLDIGVSQIEGGSKIGYARNIVAHYRAQLDRAMGEREGFVASSVGRSNIEFTPDPAKSFSRGETIYMLDGQRPYLASFDSPKSMGESVGEVVRGRGDCVELRLRSGVTLATGDGVCWLDNGVLVGSNINRVERGGSVIALSRGGAPRGGVELFRNFDRVFNIALDSSRTRRTHLGAELRAMRRVSRWIS